MTISADHIELINSMSTSVEIRGVTLSGKDIDRFFTKIDFPGIWMACWPWNAARHPRGYGQFGLRRHVLRAHRVSYRMFIGKIPQGTEIDHLCRQTFCVNPLHLEAVIHHVNILRGEAGINMSSKTHCPQGHLYDEENTNLNKRVTRRTCRACNRDRMRDYRKRGLYVGRVDSSTYRTKTDG